jgi:hypothetical protein
MPEKKRFVVEGFLEGGLFIPKSDSNLPITSGRAALTRYAILEQNLLQRPSRKIFLGLEIPVDVDRVCVAFQEMEAFVRALAIEKNVPVTVDFFNMTDKPEEWPEGIGFLETRNFPLCLSKWEPVDHFKDPKNRVRRGFNTSTAATTANLGSVLEERHQAFSTHNNYRSELVKDYLAGLDAQYNHPSLAMLYFFKVLERVGKKEYGNPNKSAMTEKTMDKIIKELDTDLSNAEKTEAKSVLRWRHKKSEAHLVTEGAPTYDELRLCKKMARLVLNRRIDKQASSV